MEFVAPIRTVLAVQFFWLSIVIIGLAFTLFFNKVFRFNFSIREYPVFAKFLIYAATGFTLFGVATLIGYLLRLPSMWLGVSYVTLVMFSALTFYDNKSSLLLSLRRHLKTAQKVRLFSATAIFIVLILFDYILSLFVGGYLGGDGFIHISKIRHIAEYGFSLTDAYYGTVPETRHHLSVMHTLYAIPSYFGIDPINSWYYSLGFLRLLKWSAVFFLAWYLLGSKRINANYRVGYASCAGILSMGLFGSYFINYPGTFVSVWVVLFIIGMLNIFDKKGGFLLIISSILIALTHPLVALGLCLFIGLFFLITIFVDNSLLKFGIYRLLALSVVLLSVTPIFSYFLPNQMTEAAANYGIEKYDYTHLLGLTAFKPDIYQYTGGLYNIGIALLAVLGMLYLIYFAKNKAQRIVILCLLLFIPLTIYNPLFSGLASKVLPIWAQARLTTVNGLVVVAPFFGIIFLFLFASKLSGRALKAYLSLGVLILCCFVMVLTQSFNSIGSPNGGAKGPGLMAAQKDTHQQLINIQTLVGNVDDNVVILAERYYDNFMLPASASVHVIAISEGNSTPAADMIGRTRCYESLVKHLDKSLLMQAKVKYVMAKRGSHLHTIAKDKGYLQLINGNSTHELFKVTETSAHAVPESGICIFKE